MRSFFEVFFITILVLLRCSTLNAFEIIKEYPQFQKVNSMSFQADTLWVGTNEHGVGMLNTRDGSFRFFDRRDGLLDTYIRDIVVDKKGVVWVGTQHGINYFHDNVWKNIKYAGNELIHSVNSLAIDSQNNLWAACTNFSVSPNSTKIFKFDGVTWTIISDFSGSPIWQIVIGTDGSLWCCQKHNSLLRYSEGKWNSYPQVPTANGDSRSLYVDPSGSLWFQGYVDGSGNSHLYKYNSLSLFQYSIPTNNSGFQFPLYSMVAGSQGIWCATYAGIALFDGKSWQGPGGGFLQGRYSWRLAKDSSGRIWVSQYGNGGLYVVESNTSVAVTEKTPSEFAFNNSPNPFNASTVISYSLPEQTTVHINIFDVTGRKVADFIFEHQNDGKHSFTWNAGNRASGVYLIRLETEHITKVGKMLLLR